MSSQDRLTLAFIERRPQSAAEVLHEIQPNEAAEFLGDIPSRIAAAAMSRMAPWAAARCLCLMNPERAALLLGAMHAPAASGLLRIVDRVQTEAILEWLPTRTAQGLRRALEHPIGTVGAWTDQTMPVFVASNMVRETLGWMTAAVEAPPSHIFVVDAEQRLLGAVSTATLSTAPRRSALGTLLDRSVKPLFASLRLVDVANSPAWDQFLALPVTNTQDRVIGGLSRSALRRGLQHDRAPAHATRGQSIFVQLVEAFLSSTTHLAQTLISNGAGRVQPKTTEGER